MLILTRKSGEGVRIGDTIVVKVIEIRGNQVRLGVEAPRDVSVHREEIYEMIRRENERASQSNLDSQESLARLWKQRRTGAIGADGDGPDQTDKE